MPSGPPDAARRLASPTSDKRSARPLRRRAMPPKQRSRSARMTGLRDISILLGLLLLANAASAQTSLAPPPAEKPPAPKTEPKAEAKHEARTKAQKPVETNQ